MSSKILPVVTSPISSFHYHADLLSVVLNYDAYNYPESYPTDYNYSWLYNNYIQLEAPVINGVDDFYRLDFHFPFSVWKTCPFIYYQRINRKFALNHWDNIIDFIIDSINQGLYIYTDFDRFYLADENNSQEQHFVHDVFIYGYDSEKETLNIAEFLENNKYTHSTISFKSFKAGFQSVEESGAKGVVNGIELITPKDERYDFDILKVIEEINDYIVSTPSHRQFFNSDNLAYYKGKMSFGLKVYGNLLYYLKQYLKTHEPFYDFRTFHVICDHKKVMLERIKYMGKHGFLHNSNEIYEQYEHIERATELIRNEYIKFVLTKNRALIEKIIDKLEWMIREEQDILIALLCNIYLPLDAQLDYYQKASDRILYTSAAKKLNESFCLSNKIHLDSNTSRTVHWKYNGDALSLEDRDDQTIITLQKPKDCTLNGYDENNKLLAICKLKSSDSHFNTNLNAEYPAYILGDWIKDVRGLVGFGFSNCLIETETGEQEQFLPGNGFYITDSTASDFELDADICIERGRAASLIFRASFDVKHFYCVNIDTIGCMKIWKPRNNSPLELAVKELEIKRDTTYHLKIKAIGNEIKAFLDGQLIIEQYDDDYSEGHIGFSTYYSSTVFQNVFLNEI